MARDILYLCARDVREALPMSDAIAAMRGALSELSADRADVPPRTHLELPSENGSLLVMPSRAAGLGRASVKLVSVVEANRTRGLPVIDGLVVLLDDSTGFPLSVLDGAAVTAIRTGAVSGVATDALARPDATSAAIFGAGVQARTQLRAIHAVRPVRRVRVFDPASAAAEAFAREMAEELGIEVLRATSPSEALEGAEVACTATTATEPVFEDTDVAPGLHINAVGAFRPEHAEVPPEVVCRARVVVDQREAALAEAGDVLRPLAAGRIDERHFHTELGEILLGRAEGRSSSDDITVFKSVGIAVEDLYAAAHAVKNAVRLGLGTTLPR